MNEEETKNIMNIIIYAGDARKLIMEALNCLGNYDYSQANDYINEANEKLVRAHRLQTNKIQEEAEGKKIEYSILFTHAQDTLMTIYSEFNIIKHLIAVFENRDKQKGKKYEK